MPNFRGVATDEPVVTSITFNGQPGDKITQIYHLALTISPTAVAANTTAEQTFTLNGIAVGDVVYVSKPTAQAGLGIVSCRVSAANTLAITFSNNTAASITPTATETYQVGGIR